VGVVLGRISFTRGGGGGATLFVDGREVVGYDGGDKSVFILVYVKYSLLLNSFL
jgi:hypothetical protein